MNANDQLELALARLRLELEPALHTLIPLLHADLRRLASAQRRRFDSPLTLGTTAIINEMYLKLVQSGSVQVENRQHFFALAALVMRQILTDHARRRVHAPATIDPNYDLPEADAATLLEVNDALIKLEKVNPRLAQVVNCRWFGGYTEIETAEILGVTDRTVRRDWEKAKAWLGASMRIPA